MIMSKRRWVASLAGVAVLSLGVLVVVACDDDKGGGDKTPAEPSATEPAGETDTAPTAVTPVGQQLEISADSLTSFDIDELAAPAGEPFTVTFDNRDTGIPHNWALYASEDDADDTDKAIAATEIETAPDVQSVVVPALDPGEYYFQCDLHPNMNGTLTAQ
jgi:plastocyanin